MKTYGMIFLNVSYSLFNNPTPSQIIIIWFLCFSLEIKQTHFSLGKKKKKEGKKINEKKKKRMQDTLERQDEFKWLE